MPLQRPSLSQLNDTAQSEINALVPGADARLRFSLLNVFARVWAGLVDGLYKSQAYLAKQLFPATVSPEFMDELGESYGVVRLAAQAARGCATFYGAQGTAIQDNLTLLRSDGWEYRTQQSAFIPASGFVEVPVQSPTSGAKGNAAAGSPLQTSSPVVGLERVEVCAAGIGGGAETESDEAYRERIATRLRTPPSTGTKADWGRWARSYGPQVTRVFVVPRIYGGGSVGIVFTEDNNGIVPPPSEVQGMQKYLEQFAPAGTEVYVFAPSLKPVDFAIDLTPDKPEIRDAVTVELTDLLYREGAPATSIPLSHIREAISAAGGEFDHSLNAPTQPPRFAGSGSNYEVGVFGTITWQ